jgi:hypothetical protein
MVTVGRLGMTSDAAYGLSSRYTTLSLLTVVGLYWLTLCLRPPRLRLVIQTAVCVLVGVGTFVTLDTAYRSRHGTRRARMQIQEALLDFRRRPDSDLQTTCWSPQLVREAAPVLEELNYTVFRRRKPQ